MCNEHIGCWFSAAIPGIEYLGLKATVRIFGELLTLTASLFISAGSEREVTGDR